jgi:hypothetical protein
VQHVGPPPPGLLAAGGTSAMPGVLPWDVLDAARAAATDKKQVMLAVANLRAVVTMLPTLLLRWAPMSGRCPSCGTLQGTASQLSTMIWPTPSQTHDCARPAACGWSLPRTSVAI